MTGQFFLPNCLLYNGLLLCQILFHLHRWLRNKRGGGGVSPASTPDKSSPPLIGLKGIVNIFQTNPLEIYPKSFMSEINLCLLFLVIMLLYFLNCRLTLELLAICWNHLCIMFYLFLFFDNYNKRSKKTNKYFRE